MTVSPLTYLSRSGVAVWLDDLSRPLVRTGGLARLVTETGVVGVTTNPSIFAAAISAGVGYEDALRAHAAAGDDAARTVHALTTEDVREAADVLRPVFDATGGRDGRVSIEVDPRLAHDTDATVEQAAALWAAVDRPNILVKIPATRAGLPAIETTIAAGISVNVTLIFSLSRYREVIDAYLTGLERAWDAGTDLATIRSVASFFVSRVDTAVDRLLAQSEHADAAGLLGTIAVANAQLAYRQHLETVSTSRWRTLAAHGAHVQRPLWASTGVKNPAYPDTLYVDELVAPDTVNTMPRKTLDAVVERGRTTTDGVDTITSALPRAAERVATLARIGIDLDEVTERLEREGVDTFLASWTDLLTSVEQALTTARTESQEDGQ